MGSNPIWDTMAPLREFDKSWTVIDVNNTTVSSNSLDYDDFTPTGDTRSGMSIYNTHNYFKDECYVNEEKIWKTLLLEEIRSGWHERSKLRSTNLKRNILQLRNVCADGRGWAC